MNSALLFVLAAPSCSISVAPRVFPSRDLPWPRLIARFPLAATPAPRPLPPALSSHGVRLGVARSPAPREPRAAASDPTASAARKASQRRRASGAPEARQRRRDKHRRRVRRATKLSMWREI